MCVNKSVPTSAGRTASKTFEKYSPLNQIFTGQGHLTKHEEAFNTSFIMANRYAKLSAKQLPIEFEALKQKRHRVISELEVACLVRNIRVDHEYVEQVKLLKAKFDEIQESLEELSIREITLVDKSREAKNAKISKAYFEFMAALVQGVIKQEEPKARSVSPPPFLRRKFLNLMAVSKAGPILRVTSTAWCIMQTRSGH